MIDADHVLICHVYNWFLVEVASFSQLFPLLMMNIILSIIGERFWLKVLELLVFLIDIFMSASWYFYWRSDIKRYVHIFTYSAYWEGVKKTTSDIDACDTNITRMKILSNNHYHFHISTWSDSLAFTGKCQNYMRQPIKL